MPPRSMNTKKIIKYFSIFTFLIGMIFSAKTIFTLIRDKMHFSDWQEADQLIEELSHEGITIDYTYESLLELEKAIGIKLKNKDSRINKAYIYSRQMNFLALIGKIYQSENGGKWLTSKDENGNSIIHAFRCPNGNGASSFIAIFYDIVIDLEDKEVDFFTLSAPYSTLQIECQ
jgi:hypothetical protein